MADHLTGIRLVCYTSIVVVSAFQADYFLDKSNMHRVSIVVGKAVIL